MPHGVTVENPRFLRRCEQVLKGSQRRVSRKVKSSKNRGKARQILGKRHLKISRQRQDHAVKLARCVAQSNDLIAYEDLRIKNMVQNHCNARVSNLRLVIGAIAALDRRQALKLLNEQIWPEFRRLGIAESALVKPDDFLFRYAVKEPDRPQTKPGKKVSSKKNKGK